MNTDDFEKRLQRLPLRKIPSEWREQILKDAEPSRHSSFVIRHSFLSTFRHQLSTILWLNPKAWIGLAAVWVLIFALHFASRNSAPMLAAARRPHSAGLLAMLKDQRQTLVELMGNNQPGDADKPRTVDPKPHSERRNARATV